MSKLLPLLLLIIILTTPSTPDPLTPDPSTPSTPSAVTTGQLITAFTAPTGHTMIAAYRTDAGNATIDITYLAPDGTQTTDVIATPPNPSRVIVLPCSRHVTLILNYDTGPSTAPITAYQLTPPPGFSFPCPSAPLTYFPIIQNPEP